MTKTIISEKEIWRPVVGFEGLYEVSDHGRVFSIRSENMLKPGTRNGYPHIILCCSGNDKTFYLHRLVLDAFVGPCPNGMECCHSNGERADNHLDNLRWGTSKENGLDMIRHGKSTRGEKQPNAKLTGLDVLCIRHWLRDGRWSQTRIARVFDVTQPNISSINTNNSWGWLSFEEEK